jgi:hypothetical protein
MKKALLSIYTNASAFFAYLFAAPAFAFAQTVDIRPKGEFGKLFDFAGQGFGDVIGRVITILFIISVIIALAFLIYGGIKWITSGGDKAAVEAARNTIVAAIVGLVIVFLSYFILNIILQAFGLTFGALQLPRLTP